jgi:hypothetical protein
VRDPGCSYEHLETTDIERLGRLADLELRTFFERNPTRAMWVGHRHASTRRARAANAAVAHADDHIAAVRAQGAPVKRHLDRFEAHARQLDGAVHPSPAAIALDDLDRREIRAVHRVLAAIDVLETWANGGAIARDDMVWALAALTEITDGSIDPLGAGGPCPSEWTDLLDSARRLLGIDDASARHALERSHALDGDDLSPDL